MFAQKHVLSASRGLIVSRPPFLPYSFCSARFRSDSGDRLCRRDYGFVCVRHHALESAGQDGADRLRWLKFIGIPLGLFFLFLVVATLWNVEPVGGAQAGITGSPQAIGRSLFTDYLLPFEATSLLILIALVGAVIFAKKDI
jgi:hypothetical protein